MDFFILNDYDFELGMHTRKDYPMVSYQDMSG